MTLHVGLHRPIKATVNVFESNGPKGCVTLWDKDGASVEIYTTPFIAKELAKAFREAFDRAAGGEERAMTVPVPFKGEIA